MFKENTSKNLLCLITCLVALPVVGAVTDNPYFRYAFGETFRSSETAKIKDAVTEFNNRFMDVYASLDKRAAVAAMPAATAMRHRLVKDSGFLWMGGRVLVYDLASLDIRSVKMEGPVMAKVVAKEEWNYQYKDGKTFKEIASVRGTAELYRYKLVKKGGAWLVLKYEPVREVKKGA